MNRKDEDPSEQCPACGALARHFGRRKRCHVWECPECTLRFEITEPIRDEPVPLAFCVRTCSYLGMAQKKSGHAANVTRP
jgi:predicted nucleic acid-binding Zn ribbon protein